MTDSYIYSTTVGNDEYSAWKIQIPDEALEVSGVKQTSDIKEVEFGIEIRDENWSNKKGGEISLKLR